MLPAVLLVHGRGGTRNYRWFPALADRLLGAGFCVLRIDLTGHGESDGEFSEANFTKVMHDVTAALQFLQQQSRINPSAIAGVGNSLGGTALILAAAQGAQFKALVLVAPVGDTIAHRRRQYPAPLARLWKREGLLTWQSSVTGAMRSLKYSYYRDIVQYDSLKLAQHIHRPVLIIHGNKDPQVPIGDSRKLFAVLSEPKELVVIKGGRHNFKKPSQSKIVLRHTVRWLKEYCAKRVSRSVVAFIMHKGKLLILKRSHDVGYYRNAWAVVGGHLPKGADPVDHAYHEVREETGLKKSDLTLIRTGRTVHIEDRSTGKVWLSASVLFESKTKRVKLDWEHTAYRWIDPERYPFSRSYPGIEKQMETVGLL